MAKPKAKTAAPDGSLEVLFPDRQLTVGGVEVTVRELSFSEQLRHNHLLAPLGDSLAAIPPAEDGQPGVDQRHLRRPGLAR